MKKILITLFCVLIFISCCNERREITYIVKFKDGSQMEVIGHYSIMSKHSTCILSHDGSYNFNQDEILYIIKK
jgi:hypothetical protein